MGEFELIERLFRPLAEDTWREGVQLGPGDDCAIQRVPEGHDLVFSVDTLVEGIHFPTAYDPARLGWRALAVAVSDLAAMGADPVCYTLAMTLPEADESWARGLVSGLAEASRSFGVALAGGDITRGPLTLTLQVHGTVPRDQAIRRSGARPGDLVAVSGPLGGAAAALPWLDQVHPPASAAPSLICYHRPRPRCDLGHGLRGLASAAIDISDGLVADLGHILKASGVGARLELDRIPLAPAPEGTDTRAMRAHALYGGDDYELCVTLSPSALTGLSKDIAGTLTVIGTITAVTEYRLLHPDGSEEAVRGAGGYDHFGAGQGSL
ncbi:thiamine-phosphate kinase [Marinobacter daqiaonensis]|uniref:Thiamine-monophosphate kinase n=1 Tax=Marinobacter daqiaonensis TaxID=650891 RepID=A0A1I6K4R2_9GAMM|nr:thiamine-phosphate kinase [Marinobacter daqiaonensis]SFR86144.1 thiamine-phosphate kinase [Marinobacter daqiaonensis]